MITDARLFDILEMLDARLADTETSGHVGIVVCGGAALLALDLLDRTTNDVDIVALINESGHLVAPAPLPNTLVKAAHEVAEVMHLPKNWLNNEPSSNEGGLFQLGLPHGFAQRLHAYPVGPCLTVWFIDRLDQIYFKLFAAVDRGGYHINDLFALKPTEEELVQAANWCFTHDVSPAFRGLAIDLLVALGYETAAESL